MTSNESNRAKRQNKSISHRNEETFNGEQIHELTRVNDYLYHRHAAGKGRNERALDSLRASFRISSPERLFVLVRLDNEQSIRRSRRRRVSLSASNSSLLPPACPARTDEEDFSGILLEFTGPWVLSEATGGNADGRVLILVDASLRRVFFNRLS